MSTRSEAGFTLLELIVTMVLAALVLTFAWPMMRGADERGLDATADRFVEGLEALRLDAMAQGASRRLTLKDAAFTVGEDFELEPLPLTPLVVGDEEEPEETLVFFPNGAANGIRWKLASERRARVIEVDWLTGGIRIRDAGR